MKKKYSKSFGFYLESKKSYFDDNLKKLEEVCNINKNYVTQPKRKCCKVCSADLQGESFETHGVTYLFCKKCQHLNGIYDDTKNFVTLCIWMKRVKTMRETMLMTLTTKGSRYLCTKGKIFDRS